MLKKFFWGIFFLIPMQCVFAVGNISGTITDASNGNPIQGATVVAVRGGNTIEATTTTNASGFYQFIGLNSGNYTVRVEATNYQTATVGVRVINNQTVTANLALVNAFGSLQGTVTDTGNAPIANATIEVFSGNVLVASTISAANGSYSITGLSPGSYIVGAVASGFSAQQIGAIIQQNVTTTVDFSLENNPGSIDGTVTDATTTDPIENALVQVFRNNTIVASTTTDASGNYTISDLSPGSYVLSVSATGYENQEVGVIVQSAFAETVDFALSSNVGTISGQVTEAISSSPIAGAMIEITQDNILVLSLLTDQNGNYVAQDLAPGDYLIQVVAADFQSTLGSATVVTNQTTTVNFALLSAPGSVAGQITDATSGDPLVGAVVQLSLGGELLATAVTDSNGNYLIENIAPGSYGIRANFANYGSDFVGVTLLPNQTQVVNLALSADSGTIEGTVRTTALDPIPGASVQILHNNVPIAPLLTDSNGAFEFSMLIPNVYTVSAKADGFQTAVLGATVPLSGTVMLDFILEGNPGSITGTIVDATTNLPIPSAIVQVLHTTTPFDTTLADENGQYTLTGLGADSYTVRVIAFGYVSAVQGVLVQEGVTTTANFSLQRNPGNLSGRVTDVSNGDPIGGASIILSQNGIFLTSAITDSNGEYLLTGLSVGTYELRAIRSEYEIGIAQVAIDADFTTVQDFALQTNPGSVSGTISTLVGANPIPGAIIQILQNTTVFDATVSDSNGDYTLSELPPGDYIVTVKASGFQNAFSNVSVVGGVETTQDFSLAANPGSLSGTVTDEITGLPIEGVPIQIFQSSVLIGATLTDINGNYLFTDLATGNFELRTVSDNYVNKTLSFTIFENQNTILNFTLISIPSPPASLLGKVVENGFLNQEDRVHQLKWHKSPSATAIKYFVLRDGELIAEIFGQDRVFVYNDHNRRDQVLEIYQVVAVNILGIESAPLTISLR